MLLRAIIRANTAAPTPLFNIVVSPHHLYPFLRANTRTTTTTTTTTKRGTTSNTTTTTTTTPNNKERNHNPIPSAAGKLVEGSQSAYVHPLSQIVLEHLQRSHSDWVSKVGLDAKGGFTLHSDGTFVLNFPSSVQPLPLEGGHSSSTSSSSSSSATTISNPGKIW